MLSQLKLVVDMISSAIQIAELKEKKDKKDAIFELFFIYYTLSDVISDGYNLLEKIDKNPVISLVELPADERDSFFEEVHSILSAQSMRLYELNGRILGQDVLFLVDPDLKENMGKLVGSKFDMVNNLSSIGASLFMYTIFGKNHDYEMQRSVILTMYPAQSEIDIDREAANEALKELSVALEKYRSICNQLASKAEILTIAKRARAKSQFFDK